MKSKNIIDALNDTDAEILLDAEPGKGRSKRPLLFLAAAAAVLLAALLIAGTAFALGKKQTPADELPAASESDDPQAGEKAKSGVAPRAVAHLNGMVFTINKAGTGYTLTGVEEETSGEISIPKTIDGLPVTRIDNILEFMRMWHFTEEGLRSIVVVDGNGYFFPLNGDGQPSLGEYETDFLYKDGCLTDRTGSVLLKAYDGAVLPDDGSIVRIGDCAFISCRGTTRIVIPEGVSSIGRLAFSDCRSLESVALPASLTNVAEDAFEGCRGLKRVEFPTASAWEAVSFENSLSNPLFTGAHLFFENGESADKPEPVKEDDLDAWLSWLTDRTYCYGNKYPALSSGGIYPIRYSADQRYTGWEYYRDHFHLAYTFDYSALAFAENAGGAQYGYTWEICYKKAGSDERAKSVFCAPWSAFLFNEDDMIIFRLPTYEAGMTDLDCPDGGTQDYEFVFIIRKGGESGEIVGWYEDLLEINDTYKINLQKAKDEGVIK